MRRTWIGILLLTLFTLAGCAVNPVTGKTELALFQISTAEEVALGAKAFPPALQQMGGAWPDARLQAYLSGVGRNIARQSHRPELDYHFVVVNDSTPNAFALPGGFIAITRGLLSQLTSEGQLAAVLGHEVGHVDARHAVQGLQRGSLLNLGLAVLAGVTGDTPYGPLASQTGELAAGLLENSYSREQERESDRLGIDYLVAAGYHPQGAVQVQEFFFRELEGGAEPVWLAGLFRTHPFSKERMLDSRAYIDSRYPQAVHDARLILDRPAFAAATAEMRQAQSGYALYDRGRQLERQGALREAIATYLQAATAAPDQALILTGLGMAYVRAEDLGAARPHLSRAVALDQNYFQSQLGLGYCLLAQGETRPAIAALEQSLELLPTLQGAFLLAEGYEKSGQTAKAQDLYGRVGAADPQGKLGQEAARRSAALERR